MKKRCMMWFGVVALFAVTLAGTAGADVYPLSTCPVSGSDLGKMGPPVVKEYDGREVRFCCAGCPAKFEANPAEYTAQIDAKIAEQQKPQYPLETCVVSGQKLGAMGTPIDYVYRNQLVRLCCKDCVGKFEKDPETYVSKLDAAVVEKQKDSYPLATCLVSGQKLGEMGKPVDYVAGTRLIRFCCNECVKQFEKDPVKILSMLDTHAGSHAAMSGTSMDHGAAGHGTHQH